MRRAEPMRATHRRARAVPDTHDEGRAATAARPPTMSCTWSRPSEGLALFFRGVTVRTAWKVSGVVGTVLSTVNQGGVIADGDATALTWVRVGVNYVVPFLVSSVGFLSARRERIS